MNKNIIIGLAVVAVIGIGVLYMKGDGPTSPTAVAGEVDRSDGGGEPKADSLPAITVVLAGQGSVTSRLNVSGMIEASEQVYVQPEIEGRAIDELAVDVGDVVKAGQVLARLADDALQLQREQLLASAAAAKASIAQFRAQIVEAKSAADEASRSRERSAKLAKRGVVSQASLDQADAAATAARARLSAARQGLNSARAQAEVVSAQIANLDYQLARTRIESPVDGLIIARQARLGAIASASAQPMFVIIRDGALEVRADVAEADLLSLSPGQSAQVQVAGVTAPLSGTVRLVEPTVDSATRLGRVRIALEDPSKVRAGMFADAKIELGQYQGVTLPVSAINRDADSARVLRVEDGTVRAVTVQVGASDERHAVITGGLSVGDQVVARAGAFVRPGDRIRPVVAEAVAPKLRAE